MGVQLHRRTIEPSPTQPTGRKRRHSARALAVDVETLLRRVASQEAAGDALEAAFIALQSDLQRIADEPSAR